MAKMCGPSWSTKQDAIMILEEEHRRRKRAVELAIRKIEVMRTQASKLAMHSCLSVLGR